MPTDLMIAIVMGIATLTILGGLTVYAQISNMREHRCGTMSDDWTWAPCIGLHIKALPGWSDYIMHYPLVTGREHYYGRWVVCKMVCDTSAGRMNRWGLHKAGECPHSTYMTPREAKRYKAEQRGDYRGHLNQDTVI
jgi:hypothetical protein